MSGQNCWILVLFISAEIIKKFRTLALEGPKSYMLENLNLKGVVVRGLIYTDLSLLELVDDFVDQPAQKVLYLVTVLHA